MSHKISIVVLGHVDHGKSTMIGRLLYDSGAIADENINEVKKTAKKLGKDMEFAFFMDSFKEEREKAMTIDIIPTPFKTKNKDYLLIDCPGHKELIKNMLSGASQADSAILIVSAKMDEGVQEQTKRHLFLAKMLGIEQIFIVINKMDEVGYEKKRFDEIKEELEILLNKFKFHKEKIFFIPISAKLGENLLKKSEKMMWYDGRNLVDIIEEKVANPESLINLPFRGLVQDIYDVKDEKIVIIKIESGKIKEDDEIMFNLCGEKGRIKEIKVFGEKRNYAETGESIGIDTKGIGISNIKRGDVASKEEIGKKEEINVKIFTLSDDSINEGEEFEIICGTAERKCKLSDIISKIDSSSGEEIKDMEKEIRQTEIGIAKLKISEPIITESFARMPPLGRFLLIRDKKIVAVGIVE